MKSAPGTPQATDEAIQAAKQANGIKNPIASGTAQAKKYGTDLLANKLNVSAKDAEKFKGIETVGTLQKEYGLTPHQAAQLHPVITGSEGASTEAMDSALENMGKVNFSDFGTTMKKELNDPEFLSANDLSESQAKNLNNLVDKYHDSLNPGATENTGTTSNPKIGGSGTNAKAAMDVAKKLENEGFKNQAASSDAKNATGDMQLKMADFIKSRIYNAPGGEDALNTAKNDAADKLNAVAQASGNTKLSSVAQNYRLAPDFKSYRSISAPFVNAKQLVDKTNINDFANKGQNSGSGGFFQTVKKAGSKVVSPGGGKILSKIGNAVDNVPSSAVTRGTEKVAGGILNKLQTPVVAQGLTRAGTVGSTGVIPNNNAAAPSNGLLNSGQLQQLENDSTSNITPTTDTNNGGLNFDRNTLVALIAADPKNASTYLSLYSAIGTDKNSASQQSTALKNEQAVEESQNALGQILQAYSAAGGGKGGLGGTIENIVSKIPGLQNTGNSSNVATYNDTATALAANIYKALGNTGTISDQDQKLIADLIPKTTDTSQTAQAKIAQLQTLLSNAQQIAAQGASQ